MPFRLIILISAFIVCSDLLGQQSNISTHSEKDYEKMHKILQDEIDKSGRDTASHSGKLVLHPAHLPAWFFKMPESNQQTLYAIGISDPGMEDNDAYNLALLRAKAIIALLMHPSITGVTDNYPTENQNLSREISESTKSFITKSIYINNNVLSINMDYN